MRAAERELTDFADLKWLTFPELREIYFSSKANDSETAFQVMQRLCRLQNDARQRLAITGTNTGAIQSLRNYISLYDKEINILERKIIIGMGHGGERGVWFAVGRRGPDTEQEIIPKRYWSFLKFDIEDGSASTDELKFSGIQCLMAEGIPDGHEIFQTIDEAQRLSIPAPTPARSNTADEPIELNRSDFPGRPSSSSLIHTEFFERVGRDQIEISLAEQARVLSKWLSKEYPRAPRATPKTIENSLRDDYKEARARHQGRQSPEIKIPR